MATVLNSPSTPAPHPPFGPVQERVVTWKELRRAYDFADNVTAQG